MDDVACIEGRLLYFVEGANVHRHWGYFAVG